MSRTKKAIGLALALGMLAWTNVAAQAAVIVKYEYVNATGSVIPQSPGYSPDTQGWTIIPRAGSLANNTTDNALEVTDAANENYGPGMSANISSADYSAGWTLTARVRVDSANSAVEFFFGLSTPTKFWNILFLPDSYPPAAPLTSGKVGTISPDTPSPDDGYANLASVATMTNAFHTYQLVGNGGDTAPELWIDGTATGTFARSYDGLVGGTSSVQWGSLNFSGSTLGVSNWQLVQFEIPEPASAGLLGLGALTLLRRKRR